jgi:MYXO-CTERM domain-containing protein
MRLEYSNLFAATTVAACAITTIAAAQATPFRGTHVGFDTASGQAGQQLQLRTGYGTSGAPESEQWAWRFQNGVMGGQLQTRTDRYANNADPSWDVARFQLFSAAPATNSVLNGGGASAVSGWYAQSSLALNPITTRQSANFTGGDAFIATNTLVGGNFAWEIMSVTALGGSSPASFGIGMMETSGITTDADRRLLSTKAGFDVFGMYDHTLAGGGSLADRSIHLGYGNHFHGWGFFLSGLGTYEISMRAYDLNGVYTASEALTFQVTSVPAPGATTLLALGALVGRRRKR